jgi:hypothetical protein
VAKVAKVAKLVAKLVAKKVKAKLAENLAKVQVKQKAVAHQKSCANT